MAAEDAPLAADFNGLRQAEPALPAAWYLDAAHHERELAAIWRREWVYLGRAAEIDGPHAFRTFRFAGREIVVLRDESGALRGFFNACRHRGAAICLAEAGRLERPLLVCPYHQWTYRLDGRLVATGPARPVAGLDRAGRGLVPVALAEWGGFLFANLAGEAAVPFAAAHGGETAALARWPLAELVVGHSYRRVLGCNWKVFWENFNECLHCPGIHPELCELVPIYGRAIMARRDDPDWRRTAERRDPRLAGGLREGAETWSMDGRAQGTLPGLGEEELAAGQRYATLLPSAFVVGHRDYVRIVRVMPLGPETTEIRAEWLFHPEMLADPDFDMVNITDFATLVLDQDGEACEMNQRGLAAAPHLTGLLMQEEYEIFLFHEWVRARLGEPVRVAAEGGRAARRAPPAGAEAPGEAGRGGESR